MTPHASVLVQWAIPGLALLVVALVGVAILRGSEARHAAWFALGAGAWLAASAALGKVGFFADFEARPPHLLLLMIPTLGLPIALGLSRVGSAVAEATPLALLIGFHAFRLPLELVMHQAALEGTMPVQMTYTGSNFDIVTGVSAIVVGGAVAMGYAPRWLLFAWNLLGTGLLVTILVIAVASLPVFQAFGSAPERVNTWVAFFPFVWLPAGLVSAAVLGHLLLWRRLLSGGMRGRALAPIS